MESSKSVAELDEASGVDGEWASFEVAVDRAAAEHCGAVWGGGGRMGESLLMGLLNGLESGWANPWQCDHGLGG